MNTDIIPTNPNQSQPRIVRRELNFDFGQFFYPNENKKIFDIRYFQSVIKDDEGNEQRIKAIVKPDATLGTLTTFDERTFYALVELWEESNRARETLFSEREIARRLTIQWGRDTSKAITQSLNRLRLVGIEWEGSFYDKSTGRFTDIKNPFTILSYLKSTSTKDKAFKAQIAEFSFDKRVIENLNSSFSRPVRFDVVLSFESPLAQAVYNLLDRKLYGTKEYNRTTEGLLLEDLSLATKSYHQKKIRHQKLKGIVNQLIGKPTAFGEVIEAVEIDPKRDVITVKRSGSETGKAFKAKPDKLIERATTPQIPTAKPASSDPPKAIIPIVEEPIKEAQGSLDYQEVIDFFQQTFSSALTTSSKSSIDAAKEILKKQNLENVKRLIRYAHQEAQKTNYEPQHFTGIVKYFVNGEEELKQEEIRIKRIKEEDEKTRARTTEYLKENHQRKHEQTYFDYVKDILEVISMKSPSDYLAFSKLELQEQEKLEAAINEADSKTKRDIAKTMLRYFDREATKVYRTVEFFQDKRIKIPDFWEWDKEINPNSFQSLSIIKQ